MEPALVPVGLPAKVALMATAALSKYLFQIPILSYN